MTICPWAKQPATSLSPHQGNPQSSQMPVCPWLQTEVGRLEDVFLEQGELQKIEFKELIWEDNYGVQGKEEEPEGHRKPAKNEKGQTWSKYQEGLRTRRKRSENKIIAATSDRVYYKNTGNKLETLSCLIQRFKQLLDEHWWNAAVGNNACTLPAGKWHQQHT